MDNYNSKLSEVLHSAHISPPSTGSSRINVGKTERIASVVGGALMTFYGLRRSDKIGITLALAGGSLLFRGATGYCPVNDATGRNTAGEQDVLLSITSSLTIMRPRAEVYQFWRQLENLPKFMSHLKDVQQLGPKRSHWVAQLPKGVGTVEWDADLVMEETDTLLAWRSLPDSDVDNAGEVRFSDAIGEKGGTVVEATISYRPPAGDIGGEVGKLLNPAFKQVIKTDLRAFKQLMETGVVPTIEGQPSGRR